MEFEKADLGATEQEAGHACALCAAPLTEQYWSAGNAMVCGGCAEAVRSGPPKAGGLVRALKAGASGVAFGLVGTAIYAAIIQFAEYELALLTIFIGWLVGQGVRRGADGRGGLGYQTMAAVLTYVMCMLSYAPALYVGATSGPEALPAPAALLFAPLLSLALPFFGDMNIISVLILAFGVYQGFRVPAVAKVTVDGPFGLKPAAAAAHEASAPAGEAAVDESAAP